MMQRPQGSHAQSPLHQGEDLHQGVTVGDEWSRLFFTQELFPDGLSLSVPCVSLVEQRVKG
jgi:hypothetical protein